MSASRKTSASRNTTLRLGKNATMAEIAIAAYIRITPISSNDSASRSVHLVECHFCMSSSQELPFMRVIRPILINRSDSWEMPSWDLTNAMATITSYCRHYSCAHGAFPLRRTRRVLCAWGINHFSSKTTPLGSLCSLCVVRK